MGIEPMTTRILVVVLTTKLLGRSVREGEIRRRRWRNNAGRSCAVPIGEAKEALQQQELDRLAVALRFFAPFSRVFSKRTNRTVFCVFLAFSKVFNSPGPMCMQTTNLPHTGSGPMVLPMHYLAN